MDKLSVALSIFHSINLKYLINNTGSLDIQVSYRTTASIYASHKLYIYDLMTEQELVEYHGIPEISGSKIVSYSEFYPAIILFFFELGI